MEQQCFQLFEPFVLNTYVCANETAKDCRVLQFEETVFFKCVYKFWMLTPVPLSWGDLGMCF